MPTLRINNSPSNPDLASVEIFFRESGHGVPLLMLHGGWGHALYPFDFQLTRLANSFRILIPDRSGYGQSTKISGFPLDFHQRAADEMLRFLDALGIERVLLWGHSDGSIVAATMALTAPDRVRAALFEAFHFFGAKRQSRELFRGPAFAPDELREHVRTVLAAEHGEPYWRRLLYYSGSVWLQIIESAERTGADLYGGRLGRLKVPCCFIHGSNDPFTEPGEIDAVRHALPDAQWHMLRGVGHSPHSSRASASETTDLAEAFFRSSMAAG